MDIKNSNGLVGKYNSRDVYVTTREEYDSFDSMYYILKDHLTVEGLLFRDRIKGYWWNKDLYYIRADRKEYKYTMKEDDAKHHQSLDLNKMCASASEYSGRLVGESARIFLLLEENFRQKIVYSIWIIL